MSEFIHRLNSAVDTIGFISNDSESADTKVNKNYSNWEFAKIVNQSDGTDKIHIIKFFDRNETANSPLAGRLGCDSILLETEIDAVKHFSLVDLGYSPNRWYSFTSQKRSIDTENSLINYLISYGVTHIDNIFITHFHSDHVDNYYNFFKTFGSEVDTIYARHWSDNGEEGAEGNLIGLSTYPSVMYSTISTWPNVELKTYSDISNNTLTWGNMTLTFINYDDGIVNYSKEYDCDPFISENCNSVGIVVEVNNHKIFLGGDIQNYFNYNPIKPWIYRGNYSLGTVVTRETIPDNTYVDDEVWESYGEMPWTSGDIDTYDCGAFSPWNTGYSVNGGGLPWDWGPTLYTTSYYVSLKANNSTATPPETTPRSWRLIDWKPNVHYFKGDAVHYQTDDRWYVCHTDVISSDESLPTDTTYWYSLSDEPRLVDLYGKNGTSVAGLISNVDIYKACHHGNYGSSSKEFIEDLNPKYVAVTGCELNEGVIGNFENTRAVEYGLDISDVYSCFSTYKSTNGIIFDLSDYSDHILINDKFKSPSRVGAYKKRLQVYYRFPTGTIMRSPTYVLNKDRYICNASTGQPFYRDIYIGWDSDKPLSALTFGAKKALDDSSDVAYYINQETGQKFDPSVYYTPSQWYSGEWQDKQSILLDAVWEEE